MRQAAWSDRDAPRAGPQPRVPPADIKTLGSSVVSTDAHRAAAAAQGPIPVGLVTVSDTRTPETDENGLWLRQQVEGGGNLVSGYRVVRDEPDEVRAALEALVTDARVVLFNGGTGVSGRD